jgi:hypothetical protein
MRKVTLETTRWLHLGLACFTVSVGYAAFFCPARTFAHLAF